MRNKTILTLFATMVMCINAWAEDNYDFRWMGIYYKITSNTEPYTVEIVQNTHYSNFTTFTIPEKATNDNIEYTVTSIGANAFKNCKTLKSINIPNTIISFGEYAFAGCLDLESILVSNNVASIGNYAFSGCNSLTTIIIESNIDLSKAALSFSKDDIKYTVLNKDSVEVSYDNYSGDVVIPSSVSCGNDFIVSSIGANSFSNCTELTSIIIPESVTSIRSGAFQSCSGLTSITIPNSVISIGGNAFIRCTNLTSIIIPNSISIIEDYAFNDCTNLDYTIYNNGYYIGNNDNPYLVLLAAKNTNITSCEINDKCRFIYNDAFNGCLNLASVTIPNSIINIGNRSFNGCSNLTSVSIPNRVKGIGDKAFLNCSKLTSVRIPNSVTYVGNYAFCGCSKLESVIISESITSINYYTFKGCNSLISVSVPNSVTNLNSGAFSDCSKLTSITIPDLVENISYEAFSWCGALKFAIIGKSVSSIGDNVFFYCNSLEFVVSLNTTPPSLTDDPFSMLDKVYVPAEAVSVYKSAPIWKRKEIMPIYDVKVTSTDNTMGTVQGDSLLLADKTLTFSAMPANGYHFVKWSDGNTDNPRTYSTAKDTSFTAIFEAHTAIVDAAVVATCTESGLTEGKHCSVCNEVIVAQETIAALGHTEVVDAAVAATCTELGLTEGKHCSVCNEILVAQDTIAALGHTEVIDAAVAATCTEVGKTEGKHCSVCNEVLVAQTEIPALGHEFVNYVYNNDATTEADGTEAAVCEHSCGTTDTRVAEGTKLATTAVAENAITALNIYAHGHAIVVENATDEICVYDAMGRLVGRGDARNVCTINVDKSGVYIVRIGDNAKRVFVNW